MERGRLPRAHNVSSASVERSGLASGARIWPVISLLPVLLAGSVLKPAGIVTVLGVDTTVLSMGLLLAASGLAFLRRPNYPLKEILPFGVFAVVVLVGVAMSDVGEYQAMKARDFFLLTGVIIACIPVLVRDVRDLRGLVFTWLFSGAIAASTVFLVGGSETLYGREGIGETTLGPAYLAAAGLVAGATAWGERQVSWLVAIPIVAVTGIAVVTIGSRGPMLSALAGLAAWAMLRGVFRTRTVIAVIALGGATLLGLRMASEESASRIFLYEDLAREDLWTIARAAFFDSPLLGLGWGDFATVGWAHYPHNAFLEVGTELGIMGILAFVALLLAGLLRTWRARAAGEVRVVGALAVAALVGQQFSGDLTNRAFWIALVPTLLCASLVSDVEPSHKTLAEPSTRPLVGPRRPRI